MNQRLFAGALVALTMTIIAYLFLPWFMAAAIAAGGLYALIKGARNSEGGSDE